MGGRKITNIKYLHRDTQTNDLIEFEAEEESDGTRALFSFAGPWLDVIENERVLVVDELNNLCFVARILASHNSVIRV